MTEEKGAIDFVVKEFKKELKKDIYGENKMIINENKPDRRKPKARNQQQIQLEKLMQQKKKKEELYLETLAKLTAQYNKED